MARTMWFGPRGNETWIPAPDVSGDTSGVTWNNTTQLLNGGASTRTTVTSHKEVSWTWSNKSRADLRPLVDVASGKRGSGLIYFIDPMTADTNVLPEQWAFPAQACFDAVPIIGDVRPTSTPTPANAFDYPTTMATYDLTSGAISRSVYIPIPPGTQLMFGWHNAAAGSYGVRVRQVLAGGYGASTFPLSLAVTDVTRFTDLFNGCLGVEIDLAPPTGSGDGSFPYPSATTYPESGLYPYGVGSVTIAGMMAQIVPNGTAFTAGNFISGQGYSGCVMSKPQQSPYSLPFDMITMSAKLVEQGDWT